jgi:hypothetical protein
MQEQDKYTAACLQILNNRDAPEQDKVLPVVDFLDQTS